jgi:preprotein translocase subunit SecA
MQVSEDTVNRELICEWLLRPVAIDVIDRVWHQPLAQGAQLEQGLKCVPSR